MKDVERVLFQASPSMFRNDPVRFMVFIILVPVVGIGLLCFLIWWLNCKCTTLTVTDRKVSLRKGILSKSLNEVRHNHIRNVQLKQRLFQRLFDVGWIGISSAGQGGVEIEVDGMPQPNKIKGLIDQYIA